jgi:RNA polymerase sigma-70 factor, ECF subfamily
VKFPAPTFEPIRRLLRSVKCEEANPVLQELDPQLLLQVQARDEAAFAEVREQLEPSIRRFVRRLTGGSEAEDDIVQDVFIALYNNLERIEPIQKLRPYAFGIARRRSYDELRQRSRYEVVSLNEEPLGDDETYIALPDDATPLDEVTHWLMLQLEVQEAMEHLPDVQRQVLIMYCEEELSYQEIAEVLGVNLGTVKSRLHYAKRALRGLLSLETLEAIEDGLG